jgi:hypothetical protein
MSTRSPYSLIKIYNHFLKDFELEEKMLKRLKRVWSVAIEWRCNQFTSAAGTKGCLHIRNVNERADRLAGEAVQGDTDFAAPVRPLSRASRVRMLHG